MTDTQRLKKILAALEWDGYGYWLPEKCVKSLGTASALQDTLLEPTMKEFREFIDDMENR